MIGDSITDAGRLASPDGLGQGWVRLVAESLREHGDDREVVNRGIGGNRLVDLAARWEVDALGLAPSVLTVYIGINDTWRRYDGDDPTDEKAFEDGYRALLRAAADAGVPEIVLVEPYLVPVTDDQLAWFDDLDPKRAAVARLAIEFDAAFVPLHRILGEAAEAQGAAAIAGDGVHPTPLGSRLIADAWLAARD